VTSRGLYAGFAVFLYLVVMNCQCQGIQTEFDERVARRELRALRKRGPRKTTRILIDAVSVGGVDGQTALDIGGGVGAIQLALAAAGAVRVMSVDASPAYVASARTESERRGFADRIEYTEGDFVEASGHVDDATIVTLDRVLCCYDDIESLVLKSAAKARRTYGLVYPRVTFFSRLIFAGINLMMRLRGSHFRGFLHDPARVDALLEISGFKKKFALQRVIWQVVSFERQ
jgi:magnesium-protoporphyrin O-methyltransferase